MSLSRRRMVTWGAAGAAGAALPLVGGGAASADPPIPDGRGSDGPSRLFDVTRFGCAG